MENKIACRFCNYLCRNNIIRADLHDVYLYGMELLLSFLTSTLFILIIGIVSDTLILTIIHLSVFIAVRRFTGGYHANSYLKCKIITIGTYVLVLVATNLFDVNLIYYTVLGICGFITITKLGPIENPNKPLTEEEKRNHKLTACILFTLLIIIGSIFSAFYQTLGNVVFFSLVSIITLMLITKLMKGEPKDEEENC